MADTETQIRDALYAIFSLLYVYINYTISDLLISFLLAVCVIFIFSGLRFNVELMEFCKKK